MCSNIPASPAYGVYISQLIRYARASSNYSDFLKRHLYLRNRLLDQGYKKIRLILWNIYREPSPSTTTSPLKYFNYESKCQKHYYVTH
jgi:hypothetical protein